MTKLFLWAFLALGLSGCAYVPNRPLNSIDESLRTKPVLVVSTLGNRHYLLEIERIARQHREFDAASWRIDEYFERVVSKQLSSYWRGEIVLVTDAERAAYLESVGERRVSLPASNPGGWSILQGAATRTGAGAILIVEPKYVEGTQNWIDRPGSGYGTLQSGGGALSSAWTVHYVAASMRLYDATSLSALSAIHDDQRGSRVPVRTFDSDAISRAEINRMPRDHNASVSNEIRALGEALIHRMIGAWTSGN